MRHLAVHLAFALAALGLSACGGGEPSTGVAPAGTVALANETDQGVLPLTVEQIFVRPAGAVEPAQNLLSEPVAPGGLVILGRFPQGQYDVVAVVEGNLQWAQNGVVVVAGQPTTLRLRFD